MYITILNKFAASEQMPFLELCTCSFICKEVLLASLKFSKCPLTEVYTTLFFKAFNMSEFDQKSVFAGYFIALLY